VAVADAVRFGNIFLHHPISVLGWKYAANRAKRADWLSHKLGNSLRVASAQTTFSCVFDKQTIYQE
jgi:hypothetical protein